MYFRSVTGQDTSNLFLLAQHPDLRIRQAVADHYSNPQTDHGSLSTPTGPRRDDLTEVNIHLMGAIAALDNAVKL